MAATLMLKNNLTFNQKLAFQIFVAALVLVGIPIVVHAASKSSTSPQTVYGTYTREIDQKIPSGLTTVYAYCDAGDRVMGGEYVTEQNFQVTATSIQNVGNSQRWGVTIYNSITTTGPVQVIVTANCLDLTP
jgi:maltodextrin utilization protein YvdJ